MPGGEDGNYIMFARATSGDKMNNRNFSPCSLKSVKRVLQAKARGSKGCFTGNDCRISIFLTHDPLNLLNWYRL